jgi:transcriptional regulator with XRE-family HTH domain
MQTLRQSRESKFISQKDLARRSGIAAVTISRLENGSHKPRFITIRKLAKALGVEPNTIDFSHNKDGQLFY